VAPSPRALDSPLASSWSLHLRPVIPSISNMDRLLGKAPTEASLGRRLPAKRPLSRGAARDLR
jgi:hypothetical protein